MEADELQPQKPRDDQERESNNADIQFQEFIHSATEMDDHSQEPMRDQQENLNDQEPCFVCNAVMVWESKRNCTGCSLTPLFPPEKEEELKEITAVYPLSKLRKICKTNPSRKKQEQEISKLLVKARQKIAAEKKKLEDEKNNKILKEREKEEETQKRDKILQDKDREILHYQSIISYFIGGGNAGTPRTSMGGNNMHYNMHMGQGNYSHNTTMGVGTGIRMDGNHAMTQHIARNYGTLPSDNTGMPGTSFGPNNIGMNMGQHGNYSSDNTGMPGTSFGPNNIGMNMGQHGNYSHDTTMGVGTGIRMPGNHAMTQHTARNYGTLPSDNTGMPGTSFGPNNIGMNMGQHGNYSSDNTGMPGTSCGPNNIGMNMGQHGNYSHNTTMGVGTAQGMVGNYAMTQHHQPTAGDLLIGADDIDLHIGADDIIGSDNNTGLSISGGHQSTSLGVAVAGSNYIAGTEILTGGNNGTAPHQSTFSGNYGTAVPGQPIQQGENSSRGMPTGPGGLPMGLAGSQNQPNTDGEDFEDYLV